ncbi:MAG: hypothetical protein ACOYLU_02710, partial [Limisphaerales bacterium]
MARYPSQHGNTPFLWMFACAVVIGMGASSGCTTGTSRGDVVGAGGANKRPKRPSGILELHLLTMPVALNLDGAPGPDGVAVKLFANVGNAAKP